MPSEQSEQLRLARALDAARLAWFHVPNGGSRRHLEAARLKASGVKAGVPDVVIVTRPPRYPAMPGVVLELKTEQGRVSPEQEEWLRRFDALGWATVVAYGADDALEQLEALGFWFERGH